jgi:hypothetical protein
MCVRMLGTIVVANEEQKLTVKFISLSDPFNWRQATPAQARLASSDPLSHYRLWAVIRKHSLRNSKRLSEWDVDGLYTADFNLMKKPIHTYSYISGNI